VKVLCVCGTRPEAIKLAPVIRELPSRASAHLIGLWARVPTIGSAGAPPITVKVCVTAQHRHLLDQVLELFDITPDHDLNVMRAHQSPTQVAAAVLARLEPILTS
jgi:UDP-N-acetylglucosamine 2-epimerase (non-hydrolysing)